MKRRVCQFPDGNGGFIPHIMDEEGQWHRCDAEGNPIDDTQPAEDDEGPKDERPSRSKEKRKSKSTSTASDFWNFHLQVFGENGRRIQDYLRWKIFTSKERLTFTALITKMILNHIRKDEEYQAYLKTIKLRK